MKKLICDNDVVMSTKDYTVQQLRLFYSMLYQYGIEYDLVMGKRCDDLGSIFISGDKVKDIVGNLSAIEICKIINDMPWKIYKFDSENNRAYWISVFDTIEYSLSDREIEFKINSSFNDYIVELVKNFTSIDIDLFLNLDSKYSQRLYELVRRYNGLGKVEMSTFDFLNFMGVPSGYNSSNIDSRVINPAVKELRKHGVLVNIEKIKKGVRIVKYKVSYRVDNMMKAKGDLVNNV